MTTPTAPNQVAFDDVPLRRFHLLVATAGAGGQFSDGYILGIIGISVVSAADALALSPLWLGLIGAGSLVGLFIGSLLTGPLADRVGRRRIFAYDMVVFAVLSVLQFWVDAGWQLLLLRLALGLALGADYVVSKSLVSEFVPRRTRGRVLAVLGVAWAVGYASAYFVGFLLRSTGPEAWRWMLISSAVPAAAFMLLRMLVPESPRWLVQQGRIELARDLVTRKLGADTALPEVTPVTPGAPHAWRQLLSRQLRSRTLIGCLFYTCQVLPGFALSTFVPRVLDALGVKGSFAGGAIYNVFIVAGGVVGMLVIDHIRRRSMLIGGFIGAAVMLAPLAVVPNLSGWLVITLLALYALVHTASAKLEFVYPQELFPTEVRASGVGLSVAASRLGSSASTSLLPVVLAAFGIRVVVLLCLTVYLIGALGSWLWAPETGRRHLTETTPNAPVPAPTSTGRPDTPGSPGETG